MKKAIHGFKVIRSIMIAVALLTLASHSRAQQLQPSAKGYVPVNGIKVYYETYGKGSPLVLIHGAFMDIQSNWAALLPELSKNHRIIALEMQGHGHTQYYDRKLDITTMASDVAGVMDYLKVDSADVAGYSMGGSIAYALIIKNSKRVKKLVIISSTYKSAGWRPEVTGAFKVMKPEMFDNSPMKTAYEATAPDKTKWPKFAEQMLGFIGNEFDLGDSNIAKITSPVLIISGDNDGLDKVELAKTYQMLGGGISADMAPMPKSQLAIIPAQSHVGVMMQSKPILDYMTGFLK